MHGTPGENGWLPAEPQDPADPDADGVLPGYGIALLSRLPVAEWHVLRMPASPGRFPLMVPAGRRGCCGCATSRAPSSPRCWRARG